MATNPIVKLSILKAAKQALTNRARQLQQDQNELVNLAPGELDAQALAVYSPILTEINNALTRVDNAIAAITIVNADKSSYADAAINAAKAP